LEEIAFSLKHRGESEQDAAVHARELLERFSMQDMEEGFPLKFSRGEKQRLAMLAILAMKPIFYILDEPTSGIDEENKRKLIGMLRNVKNEGAGLCIITHDKELIEELSDRVITMENGSVIHDENT
jgi:energy-coupling factor transporter ATP-binding protein EcfA2